MDSEKSDRLPGFSTGNVAGCGNATCVAEDKPAMVTTTENPHSEFIGRVSNLPVVTTALSYASNVYDKAKESNVLVKTTLDTAEVTAKFAVEQAAPVVTMLEKPLTMMDSLACKGLDQVEEKLPVITKSPQEIVDTAKTYGVQKVDDLKSAVAAAGNYSYSTATSLIDNKYGMMALDGVNWTVSVADKCVDRFLPGEGQETERETQPSTAASDLTVEEKVNQSMKSVVNVSSKVQQRLYHTTLAKLQEIQIRSQETVKSFTLTIDLIQYVKDNLNTASTATMDKAKHMWQELNKEVGEDGDEKLDVCAMNAARKLTRQMVLLCTSAREAIQVVPANMRGRIENILEQASGICSEVTKATTIQELTSLDKLKERVKEVQERLVDVTMNVTTWLTRILFGSSSAGPEAIEMEDKSKDRSGEVEARDVNMEVGTE